MPVKYFIAKFGHYSMCLNLNSLCSYFWDMQHVPAIDNTSIGYGFFLQVVVSVQPGLFLQILIE
jgi:hypothetical protein